MYKNKCTKCGAEFETKNPKRVICPGCLYPDRKDISLQSYSNTLKEKPAEPDQQRSDQGDRGFKQKSPGYYVAGESPRQNGFNRQDGPPRQGGFNRQGGPPQNRRRPAASNKKLLISREQVAEIENLYRNMLPLPNPDCHEVIGEKIELEPNKVFFGINLVRQKMKLPKLPYPKRRLAVSSDQLMAIKNLYSPLLPLPPIGCHKIIAKQLKMDEWRVHVGIGILRKQMNLPRWNTEREDAPEEFKNQPVAEEPKAKKTASKAKKTKEKDSEKEKESEE